MSRDRGGDQDQSGVRAFSSPESLTTHLDQLATAVVQFQIATVSKSPVSLSLSLFGGFPLGTAIRVMPARARGRRGRRTNLQGIPCPSPVRVPLSRPRIPVSENVFMPCGTRN